MVEAVSLYHERVDDLPLLLGLMQRWGLPEVLDEQWGQHWLHQGLSNGHLAMVWLAYILSAADHRKASVQEWAQRHQHTLQRCLGQSLRATEFTDDRLAIVLRRFSQESTWHAVESALWPRTLALWEMPVTGVRLDGTTTYGFHAITPEGLLQCGHSKDRHPELGQIRVMAAAVQPTGHVVAVNVHPGNGPDDPCYAPLYEQVRQILGQPGLLYAGDCKMAALQLRASFVAHGDRYLVPLPTSSQTKAWLEETLAQALAWELVWDQERLLGAGQTRTRSCRVARPVEAGGDLVWTEQVLLVRSLAQLQQETQQLARQRAQAEAALLSLTPPRGPGRRVFRTAATLKKAIAQLQARHGVEGLLQVHWEREEETQPRHGGPGRPRRGQPRRSVVMGVCYRIRRVERDAAAWAARVDRLGWRTYATNAPAEELSLSGAVVHYRGGWCLERDFHLLKDRPLGIRPLYVRREDQVRGLVHLLMLGVRLLTLLEGLVRQAAKQAGERWTGLYPGQPQRATERPTAKLLLNAVARSEITLTRIDGGTSIQWHLTPLPSWLVQVLTFLGLPPSLYGRLAENSS
jgi:transposase